jgi:hypothetical protein
VLVPGCRGGMFDHNTMRVLTSFRIVFLTSIFDSDKLQVIALKELL